MTGRLKFDLPLGLEASEPPEARGLTRDGVRMMVARKRDLTLDHSTFALLPRFLSADDLLVINTSATMAAALAGVDPVSGECVAIHLSSRLGGDEWVVEPRKMGGPSAGLTGKTGMTGLSERWPLDDPPPPGDLRLGEDGSSIHLYGRYLESSRLWRAELRLPQPGRRGSRCTGGRSGTDTSDASGRSRRTRTSTPPSRGAPRCLAPGALSRRRSSPVS